MPGNRFFALLVLITVYIKLINCFNIQSKEETVKFLTSPLINPAGNKNDDAGLVPTLSRATKPAYYGEDIAIQKLYTNLNQAETDISIVIGSPKLKNAKPFDNHGSATGSTGGIYACKIKNNAFASTVSKMSSSCSLTIPKAGVETTGGENFGLSVPSPQFYSKSYKVCTSTRSVGCTSLNFVPGFCYVTTDAGETWRKDSKSAEGACHHQSVDVMFVIDGSGSIYGANFKKIRQWVADIAKRLKIDQGQVQVGVLQFAQEDSTRTEIALGERKTYKEFKKAVMAMRYMDGRSTFTGEALEVVQTNFKQSSRYKKKNTRQLMILLTDGESSYRDRNNVRPNAIKLRNMGVETYAVGVADAVEDELEIIAGDKSRVFKLTGFDNLKEIIGNLKSAILISLEDHVKPTAINRSFLLGHSSQRGKSYSSNWAFTML